MITFTFRELKSAWRQAGAAFETADSRTNAHRLLLFYAVETGLKAVYLHKNSKMDTSGNLFSNINHDLNKLMDILAVGKELKLKTNICLELDVAGQPTGQRNARCGELNQIWRYGAQAKKPTDLELETQLLAIQEWLRGELT